MNGSDVKLYKSAIMRDTNDGGGARAKYLIASGDLNEVFDPISSVDLARGEISLRKVWIKLDSDDLDRMVDAHVVVTADPSDEFVSVFALASTAATRSAAVAEYGTAQIGSVSDVFGSLSEGQTSLVISPATVRTFPSSASVVTYQATPFEQFAEPDPIIAPYLDRVILSGASLTSEVGANPISTTGATVSAAQQIFGGDTINLDGSGSIAFDLDDLPGGNVGTGDFSLEFYYRPGAAGEHFFSLLDPAGPTEFVWFDFASNGLIGYNVTGNSGIDYAGAITAGAFNHIAIARVSGTLTLWVNGAATLVTAFATSIDGKEIRIGSNSGGAFASVNSSGFFAQVRLIKGSSFYSTAFTPPAAHSLGVPMVAPFFNETTEGFPVYLAQKNMGVNHPNTTALFFNNDSTAFNSADDFALTTDGDGNQAIDATWQFCLISAVDQFDSTRKTFLLNAGVPDFNYAASALTSWGSPTYNNQAQTHDAAAVAALSFPINDGSIYSQTGSGARLYLVPNFSGGGAPGSVWGFKIRAYTGTDPEVASEVDITTILDHASGWHIYWMPAQSYLTKRPIQLALKAAGSGLISYTDGAAIDNLALTSNTVPDGGTVLVTIADGLDSMTPGSLIISGTHTNGATSWTTTASSFNRPGTQTVGALTIATVWNSNTELELTFSGAVVDKYSITIDYTATTETPIAATVSGVPSSVGVRRSVIESGDLVALTVSGSESVGTPVVDTPIALAGAFDFVELSDSLGATVDQDNYTTDRVAETLTVTGDLSAFTAPFTATRYSAQITVASAASGDSVTTSTGPKADLRTPGVQASSLVLLGDLETVISPTSTIGAWSGDFDASGAASASYDEINHPIELTNRSAVTDRWSIVFTSSAAFTVRSESLGNIATGTTAADCAPVNPATGAPYFTIRSAGWGSGWVIGNALRFDTTAAEAPIWLARVVNPSTTEPGTFSARLQVRGNIVQV